MEGTLYLADTKTQHSTSDLHPTSTNIWKYPQCLIGLLIRNIFLNFTYNNYGGNLRVNLATKCVK